MPKSNVSKREAKKKLQSKSQRQLQKALLLKSQNQSERERLRQISVNQAFLALRNLVPCYPPDKKMSKHEILRATIRYIKLLREILQFMESDANDQWHVINNRLLLLVKFFGK